MVNTEDRLRIVTGGFWSEKIYGTMYEASPHFATNIKWLIAPLGMWFLSTVFFISTMWNSLLREYPFWKSSPLILIHCLDNTKDLKSAASVKQEAKLRGATVVLQRTATGVHVVEGVNNGVQATPSADTSMVTSEETSDPITCISMIFVTCDLLCHLNNATVQPQALQQET